MSLVSTIWSSTRLVWAGTTRSSLRSSTSRELLQWARRTNLLQADYDRRLDDLDIQTSVLGVLSCIRLLLTDEAALQQRYGLQQSEEVVASNTVSRRSSGPLMKRLFKEFEALNLRIDQHSQTAKWRAKFRWVIRDKPRFENLVTEMAHFTTKLNELLPTVDDLWSWHNTHRGDFRDMSVKDLRIILEASAGHEAITDSVQDAIHLHVRYRILRRLWFRTIDDREQAVAQAYEKTLQWALQPPQHDFAWDDLSHWLQCSSSSGIYWVSGKAGSGKSTLMKYLYQNPRARHLIAQWASGPHTIVRFFFWNLGTAEQKSQEGLSRTLLYQILSHNKSLIAIALPNMWKEAFGTECEFSLPSPSETVYAFQIISENSLSLGKICFFIDGLDEFSGNYMDGVSFIKGLATSPSIKIVVSSRPIPDCVAAFESMPKLQLHQLTRCDIQAYVHGTIGTHAYMKGMMKRYPEEASEIVNSLIEKSSGVFLWVILACRSLLSGFASYDRIKELRFRVDELPLELDQMFQHMLNKIEPRYRGQGAELLRLCYTKRRVEGSHDMNSMSALGLALFHENPDLLGLWSLNNSNMRQLCEDLAGRLRSRCGGLLELTPRSIMGTNVHYCFCGAQRDYDHDCYIDGKVDFMHRTVYEFLSLDQTWELPCLQVPEQESGYSTSLSLIGLLLASVSLSRGNEFKCYERREEQAGQFFRDGIQWGSKSDLSHPFERRNIFWRLQPFLQQLVKLELTHPFFLQLATIHEHAASPTLSHAPLVLALESDAFNYVKAHPELLKLAGPDPPPCGCLPALHHATTLPCLSKVRVRWGFGRLFGLSNPRMASLLLSFGRNPNTAIGTKVGIATPWENWLSATKDSAVHDRDMIGIGDIMMMFINAGADQRNLGGDLRNWVASKFLYRSSSLVRNKGQQMLELLDSMDTKLETNCNSQPQIPMIEKRKLSPGSMECQYQKRNKKASS
ncbi:small s [Fusarium albosuccineum]|uniref:Small s n=1 Tax=Fusarium albosuccineum TaxID=1237068 RepID=A0A8H4L267_9HYPO|nr:small s [Fusarium albosuccineum]